MHWQEPYTDGEWGDLVGIVWDGDLCYGDPDGWCETPWVEWVAMARENYRNIDVAVAFEPLVP